MLISFRRDDSSVRKMGVNDTNVDNECTIFGSVIAALIEGDVSGAVLNGSVGMVKRISLFNV